MAPQNRGIQNSKIKTTKSYKGQFPNTLLLLEFKYDL